MKKLKTSPTEPQSEERYRLLTENAGDTIWAVDLTGKLTYISPSVERLCGFTPEECLARSLDEALTPASMILIREDTQKIIAEAISGEPLKPHHLELEFIHKNGSAVWVEVTSNAMLNAAGELVGIQGISRDITARKRRDEALRESEERYRSLFENAVEGIVIVETKTRRFLRANPAFCRMLGYSPEEISAMGVGNIHPAESLEYVLDEFNAQTSGKKALAAEIPCLRKDGTILYADIAGSAILIDGKMCNVGFFTDVTERKKLNDALREGEERFKQVAESAGEWIWEVDTDGLYTFASPAVEKILGYKPGEIIGKMHFYDFFMPDEREAFKKTAFEVFARKGAFRGFVNQNLHKNGNRVILETSGVPCLDEQGRLIGYRGADTDITEHRKAEEALEKKVAELASFIDNIPDMAWLKDVDSNFIAANKAFGNAVGMNPEDLVNHTCEICFGAEAAKGFKEDDMKVMASKQQTIIEESIIDAKNNKIWLETVKSPILDVLGNVIGTVGIARDITERRKLEAALRESEERYRQLVDKTDTGFVVVDDQGIVIEANEPYMRLIGAEKLEEITGHSVIEWTAPEAQESNAAAVALCARQGFIQDFETIYLHRNGSHIHININATTHETPTGKRLVSLCRNITERKRVEEALRLSEKNLRDLAESLTELVYRADPDTFEATYVNSATRSVYGYTVEEWLNDPKLWENTIHPDDKERVFAEFSEATKEGRSAVIEYRIIKKDKTIRWVEDHAGLEKDLRGKIISLNGVMYDITERKRLEESLRENETRLRTVLEAVPEGITFSDEMGHFAAYNSKMERLTGFSADEANASSDYMTLLYPDPKDREKALAGLSELATIGMSREVETKIRTKDGMQKYVLVSTTLVPYQNQRMFLSSYHDITERKRTEGLITKLGFLKEGLLGALDLSEKLKIITDGVVEIFGADFARIWLIREGDLCEKGCIHANLKEGPDVCRDRTRCLHLVASSGRYTHIDGNHRRVPLGCYKIGRVASGEDSRSITNDVAHDPRVHNHDWARALGLVSFAGFRLLSSDGVPIGVMALFSKLAIPPVEEELMAGLANLSSQIILSDKAREALLKSEAKFRTLFENANDAIFLLKDDIFIDCNTKTLQMFQRSRDQIVGQTPYRFSPPFQPDGQDSKEKALEKIQATLAGNRQSFEWKHCLNDGTLFDAEVSLNSVELGGELFIQAIVRDISERKRLEAELRRQSIVDELTGLFNRRGFLTLAEQQLKFAERAKKSLILFFMDLDHMKWVNDTLGHREGDRALAEIAAVLRQTFRKSDIIGRMGGDEFAVLAIDTAHEVGQTVARLCEALDSFNQSETRTYKLSLSLGTAHFDPDNPSSLDDLMVRADNLMYGEKRTKRQIGHGS